MAGPTGFQDDRSPAFQPEQGNTVILHVKRFLLIDFTFAPIGLSQAARTELGEGLRRDRLHVEFAEQMQAGVEHVHAEVRRAAAAGKLFLREPRANAWDAAAPQPETARVIDFAQVAAVQDRFADLRMAIEPEILRD